MAHNEMWLSLVERCVRDAEAAGSNPVISTKNHRVHLLINTVIFFKIKISGHHNLQCPDIGAPSALKPEPIPADSSSAKVIVCEQSL